MLLTGYGGAVQEGSMNLRIHFQMDVALLRQHLVVLLDLFLDPIGEWVANDGVGQVGDVLLRQPLDLDLVRVVVERLGVLADEFEQTIQSESVEMRNVEMSGFVGLDESLLARDQVLELHWTHV